MNPKLADEFMIMQAPVKADELTLRDYFASAAISIIEPPRDYVGAKETAESYKRFAEKAYRLADAMLEARK